MTNLDVALRFKMLKVGDGAKAVEKDLKGIKGAADAIGKGAATGKLGADLAKVGAATKTVKRDILDLKSATDRLGTSDGIRRWRGDLAKGLAEAREALKVRRQLHLEAQRAAREERRAQREAAKAAERGGVGTAAAMGAGALAGRVLAPLGVGYAGKRALDAAVDFEAGMAEVRKKVNFNNPEEFARIEATIRKLAMDLGIARVEMAGLTAEAGASGIAVEDLERFMKLTGKASVGWDMAPREAAQAMAEMKAGLQMTIPELEVLGDKINALGDDSAAKERDIVHMFQVAGAAAKGVGVDMDTSLAFLTGAKAMGVQADVGARWWGAFTSRLGAGFKGKKAKEALAELGLDEKKLQAAMKAKPFETMIDFMERLDKAKNKVAISKNLFGDEWFDETLRVVQGLAEIKKQHAMLGRPSAWSGSLDKGLQVQLATTKNHFERLKVLSGEVGDRLSRWALPPINSGIEWLIGKFDELTTKSNLFSQNMAWLEGRFPSWFGKAEPTPEAEKAPDNNPWRGVAAKKMEVARGTSAEAEALRKEAAGTRDKKKRAALEARASHLDQLAAGDRRAAGMAAARDETGIEDGVAFADGLRARQAAERTARLDRTEKLFWERRQLKGQAVGRSRAALQAQAELRKNEEELRGLTGMEDVDRAGKILTLLEGRAAQKRIASDRNATPRARSEARASVGRLEDELYQNLAAAPLGESAKKAFGEFIQVLAAEGTKAVDESRKIAEEMSRVLSFTAHPTIAPIGAPPGGGAGGATPGKQSSLSGPTVVHQHINGADPARVARAAQREQDRAIRSARAGALHDLGSNWA